MPNYSLVSNAVFQPFSYQELVAPVLHQQQVMDNLADEYDKMSEKADLLNAMAENEKDKNSKAYQQYKSYSDGLRSEADNLFRNGLDAESRMRLSQLRKRYNAEIVPIQNAWTKREAEAAMQQKAYLEAAAKGIDLRFSRNAADSTIQSYLENPNQTFRTINGQQITTEVANQFKALANQIKIDEKGTPWIGKKQLSPFEYNIIIQKGMDFNEYQDFIRHPDDPKFANIKGIINNTLAAHNISEFDPKTQEDMFKYGAMGVSSGVGVRDSQFHTDTYAVKQSDYAHAREMENLSFQHKLAVEDYKNQLAAANAAGEATFDIDTYNLPMMGANFDGGKDREAAMKTLGYEKKNGKLVFTGKVKVDVDGADKDTVRRNFKEGNPEAAYAMATERGSFEASTFNSDGTVKTRAQFIAQGKTAQEKKALGAYFDKMADASRTLGMYGEKGSVYTRKQLSQKYMQMRQDSAAGYAPTYNLNYEKGDVNTTTKGYMAQELESYKNGKPVYNTKRVSVGSILNKKNSDKSDIDASMYWSSVDGHEGLIIATVEDGKAHRYFVGADQMPPEKINGKEGARYWFRMAEEARKQGDINMERQCKVNGMAELHKGLTTHNIGFDRSMVRQQTLKQQLGED